MDDELVRLFRTNALLSNMFINNRPELDNMGDFYKKKYLGEINPVLTRLNDLNSRMMISINPGHVFIIDNKRVAGGADLELNNLIEVYDLLFGMFFNNQPPIKSVNTIAQQLFLKEINGLLMKLNTTIIEKRAELGISSKLII